MMMMDLDVVTKGTVYTILLHFIKAFLNKLIFMSYSLDLFAFRQKKIDLTLVKPCDAT